MRNVDRLRQVHRVHELAIVINIVHVQGMDYRDDRLAWGKTLALAYIRADVPIVLLRAILRRVCRCLIVTRQCVTNRVNIREKHVNLIPKPRRRIVKGLHWRGAGPVVIQVRPVWLVVPSQFRERAQTTKLPLSHFKPVASRRIVRLLQVIFERLTREPDQLRRTALLHVLVPVIAIVTVHGKWVIGLRVFRTPKPAEGGIFPFDADKPIKVRIGNPSRDLYGERGPVRIHVARSHRHVIASSRLNPQVTLIEE